MGKPDNIEIVQGVPLMEFFRERIQNAFARKHLAASPMTEFYLTNMLNDFRKADAFFQREEGESREEALALLLLKAIDANLNTKIRYLKRLGDISLYTAGFFKERVRIKKTVDLHYYIRMGGGAYLNLATILENDNTFSGLYTELAQLFPHLVEVLTFVARKDLGKSNKELIDLYEKWLATGDTSLEELLNQAGIPTTHSLPDKT